MMQACLKDELIKKFENSIKIENDKIYVYLADHRIVDFEGRLIGFFDTEKTLNPHKIINLEDKNEYVSVDDFESLEDFQNKIKTYLCMKGGYHE